MPGRLVLIAAAFAACLAASPAAEARPRPPASGPVVLVGEIDVGGKHEGVVELRLDGELVASVPAANGAFELEMPRHGGAGMVILEFHAPDLRLRSLLGGQGRLALRAGADGRLAVAEEDRLRLSPLSTAVAVLASGLDLVPPAGDDALADALQATWGSDIRLATTAIERLAVEPGRLPPGIPDGMALAEDPAAFNHAVQEDPALVSDPHLVFDALEAKPLSAGDVAGALVFTGPRAAPGVPTDGPGMVMERVAEGFRLHDHMFDGPSWSGGLDAQGALVIEPLQLVREFAGYYDCPSLGWTVAGVVDTTRRDFRRLWQGVGMAVWHFGSDHELSFPECPELETVEWRSMRVWTAPDMARARALTQPRRFVGRQSLPVFCGYPLPHWGLALEPCGQADHVFNADGSGVAHPDDGPPLGFSWGRGPHGGIRVDYGDASARFWILEDGDRRLLPVAYVAEAVVVGYPGTSSGQATLVRGGQPEGAHGALRRPRAGAGSGGGPRYQSPGD